MNLRSDELQIVSSWRRSSSTQRNSATHRLEKAASTVCGAAEQSTGSLGGFTQLILTHVVRHTFLLSYGGIRQLNAWVSCLLHSRTIDWTHKWKKAQNIHLAQDCIQPWLQWSNACHIYIMNTSAPPGYVMIYISHQTSAKWYADQTLWTLKWKDNYLLLIWRLQGFEQNCECRWICDHL